MNNRNKKKSQHKKASQIVFLIIFLLFISGYQIIDIPKNSQEITSLISVEIHTQEELDFLKSQDIKMYTRLYKEHSDSIYIIQASYPSLAELSNNGIEYKILDENATGKSYYLAYGSSESLERLQSKADILFIYDRQAIIGMHKDGIEQLTEYNLRILPLIAQEISGIIGEGKGLKDQAQSVEYSALVAEMINQVDTDNLYDYIGNLSGEWATMIDGSPYRLETRYTYTDIPIKKATRYGYEFFSALGLPSSYAYYTISGFEKRNVIAQKTGESQAEHIYLIVAHIDSRSENDISSRSDAPGADDNASGAVAVMHIAEILNQYRFDCSLRFVLFTGEEQGLYGSKAYANTVYNAGEKIEGVLNLDMLAYNTIDTDPTFDLHTRPGNAGDLEIATLFNDVVSTYGIDLDPQIKQDGITASDHSPFWNYGYSAILAIEDWNDFTPYYHKTTDQLSTLNMPYYTEFVKAALATLAHMGCLIESEINGIITDTENGLPISNALIEVWQNGEKITSTNSGSNGSYRLFLNPGTYDLVFSAADHLQEIREGITLSSEEVKTIDIDLEPCITVKGLNYVHSPDYPDVDQTVSFTATISSGESPITFTWNFGDENTGTGQVITHTYTTPQVFWINLEANNRCQISENKTKPIFVGVDLSFLPLISKNTED